MQDKHSEAHAVPVAGRVDTNTHACACMLPACAGVTCLGQEDDFGAGQAAASQPSCSQSSSCCWKPALGQIQRTRLRPTRDQ